MSTHLIGWDATLEEQRVKFIYSADSSTGSGSITNHQTGAVSLVFDVFFIMKRCKYVKNYWAGRIAK